MGRSRAGTFRRRRRILRMSAISAAGFRRVASSLSNRDLTPVLQDRMIELAFYLYDRNPFAKRLINLSRAFVMGEGMRPKAEDADLQAWLDDFWDDPVNDLDMNLPGYVAELGIFGEQLYQTTVNPIDGSTRLWYIDPSEIDQVVYAGAAGAERAVAMPVEIKLKDYYPGGGRAASLTLEAIRPDEDPFSPSFGKLVGNAFYFAVNKVKRAARGRSDIFALADWLDSYEQFLFALADRAELLNSFVWDITLKGMTQAEIDDWLKKYGTRPRPASIRAHNENVTYGTAAPDLQSADMAASGRQFKNHILGAAGFPESWFGEGGETNLATAVEQGGPTFKTLKERQRFVKNMAWTICNYAIDQGTLRGSLDPQCRPQLRNHCTGPGVARHPESCRSDADGRYGAFPGAAGRLDPQRDGNAHLRQRCRATGPARGCPDRTRGDGKTTGAGGRRLHRKETGARDSGFGTGEWKT